MTIQKMRIFGDPVLRTKASPVAEIDAEIHKLLADMTESMRHYQGIGLAAPQIGVSLAVAIISIDEHQPLLELINPEIVHGSGEEKDVEGCLSVPGIMGAVSRHAKVAVNYLDRQGRKNTLHATGLLARALQHEIDHLNGILFTDKVIEYVDSGDLS